MESLLENIKELQANLTIVTETWMHDKDTQEVSQDLSMGAGLGLLVRNRERTGQLTEGWQCYGERGVVCSGR